MRALMQWMCQLRAFSNITFNPTNKDRPLYHLQVINWCQTQSSEHSVAVGLILLSGLYGLYFFLPLIPDLVKLSV